MHPGYLLLQKLDDDEGFGCRFYRALAVFLADRLRASRKPTAHDLSDSPALSQDELDPGIIDHVSSAGERFNRMPRILRQQGREKATRTPPAMPESRSARDL